MTGCLPEDEGVQLRVEFEAELLGRRRLSVERPSLDTGHPKVPQRSSGLVIDVFCGQRFAATNRPSRLSHDKALHDNVSAGRDLCSCEFVFRRNIGE